MAEIEPSLSFNTPNDDSDAEPKSKTTRGPRPGEQRAVHVGIHVPPSLPPAVKHRLSGEVHRSKESCMKHGSPHHNEETNFQKLLRCLAEEHERELEMLKKALHASFAENLIEMQERKRRSARSRTGSRREAAEAATEPGFSQRGSLLSSETQQSACTTTTTPGRSPNRSGSLVAKLWNRGGDAVRRVLSDRHASSASRKVQQDDFTSPMNPTSAQSSRHPSTSSSRAQGKYAGDARDESSSSSQTHAAKVGAAHAARHSNKKSHPALPQSAGKKKMSDEALAFRGSNCQGKEGKTDDSSDSDLSDDVGNSKSDAVPVGSAVKADGKENPGESDLEEGHPSSALKASSSTPTVKAISSTATEEAENNQTVGNAPGLPKPGLETELAGTSASREGSEAKLVTSEVADDPVGLGKRSSKESVVSDAASDESEETDPSIVECPSSCSAKKVAEESSERPSPEDVASKSDRSLPKVAKDESPSTVGGSDAKPSDSSRAEVPKDTQRESLSSDCTYPSEHGSASLGDAGDGADVTGGAKLGHLAYSIRMPAMEAEAEPEERKPRVRLSLNGDSGTNMNSGRRASFAGRAEKPGMAMPAIDEQIAGSNGRRRPSFQAQMLEMQKAETQPICTLQLAEKEPLNMDGSRTESGLRMPRSRAGGGSILKTANSAPRQIARHRISFDEAVTSFDRTRVEIQLGQRRHKSTRNDDPEVISFDNAAVTTLRDIEDDECCEQQRTTYAIRPLWAMKEEEEGLGERGSVNSKEAGMRARRTEQLRKLFTEESGGGLGASFQGNLLRVSSACSDDEDNRLLQGQSTTRRMLSQPNSTFNFCFDSLSMFFIAADILMIPLAVFSPEENWVTELISASTTVFWSCDLVRNFFVGHFKNGKVVMEAQAIVWNYLTTWFVLDFSIVMLDWTMLLVKIVHDEETREDNATHILRAFRNVRTLRLLRSMKASRLLKLIEDRINSEVVSVLWTLGKIFCMILVINHLIACTWYWIGKRGVGNLPNWVEGTIMSPGSELLEPGEFQLHTKSLEYRYFTSFHWATTHFVSSQISIEPNNIFERIFAIIVVFFALVAVSSFIGGLTNAVMHLGSMSSAKSKQFWLLKRYLRESHVPAQLSVRIHNYCDFVWQAQEQRVQESSVQVLSLLSQSLRSELDTAIYEPRLASHPFFVLIGKVAPMTIRFLCSNALSRTSLGRGDCLFSTQEMASQMWFVCAGQLMYYMDEEDPEEVEEEMWLCEPVLWVTEWTHRGTVQVNLEADLVAVDSEKFGSCLHSNLDARFEAAMYCKGFVQNLNRAMSSRVSDLYRTPLIEGLWFRLINDNKSNQQTEKTKSRLDGRRGGLEGHRPLITKTWSNTMIPMEPASSEDNTPGDG